MGPKRLDLFLINISAHNVYYVKLQTKTSKPLVMRVNLRKPLFSVP